MGIFKFWIDCFLLGISFGDHILLWTEIICGLFWLFYRERGEEAMKTREDKIRNIAKWALIGLILFSTFLLAPYLKYDAADSARQKAQTALDDKSAKLDGFIDQFLIAQEPGTTNSLIFLQATIGNSGGSASIAESYRLKVTLTNNESTNAELINFADEWKTNTYAAGKPYLIDLKRPQLISEKTSKAIQPGEAPRGWIAFRLNGVLFNQFKSTNIFLSFIDISGKRIIVTNQFWKGKPALEMKSEDVTQTLPGSESLMVPIEPVVQTNIAGWMPPELPPGCSNITVFFGSQSLVIPRLMAEASPEEGGTKFLIKDLPDFYLQNLDKMPNYSPRQKYMWIRSSMSYSIGGKTVPFPIQPVVISNRLYVEVEIPFSNEKRKLIMSDSFDPELPIPRLWDRNFSTNYISNGLITGGIYAYEVVNELTNPVLQVAYSAPNEVHVWGVFKVDAESDLVSFGQPPQLLTFSNWIAVGFENTQRITTVSLQSSNFSETLEIYTNDSAGSIGEIYTNEFYRPIFPGQRAIFKYPSNKGNIGAFADWLVESNKSDTNTLDMKQ